MCYYIKKNMIILLKMNDKCKNDQCPTSQKCENINSNYEKKIKLTHKKKKQEKWPKNKLGDK